MNEYAVARRRMVEEQLVPEGVTDPRVLQAMAEIPRHRFVPRLLRHRAYEPCALPIGYGQTISQPLIVGLMSMLLELDGSEKVLEVGTGSGYQAAVLSRLADRVLTVERIEPLALRAARTLRELGIDNVEVLTADGRLGLPEEAPFDAIIVTASPRELPRELFHQLRDGGRLVIPIGPPEAQVLYRYTRRGDDAVVERSLPVRFVPLLDGVERETDDA